jgi:DNA topoisomerase-1
MSKNLVIVESPAKAKTIENYLGSEFTVKSSYGHVRDLPKDNHSIDILHGFEPHYEISADKIELVKELRKLAKQSDMVWLATDDDREGEAISWHLKEALQLTDIQTKRIVFREITKPAILKAIENPRGINYDLVNAQQARRVLDRLVGFELSPVLWKKIKRGLSAGRVQSVAVRLIVDREREIDGFNSTSSFRVTGKFFTAKGKPFTAEVNHKFNEQPEAQQFLQDCLSASFSVSSLETKPAKRSPAAPFTTSTLQQEASHKLGFSVSQTMSVAQRLYEAGHITYMRTDSLNLSEMALEAASNAITAAYGAKYSKTRRFKTKNESAQEAHEAIRPTDFGVMKAGAERNDQRLYELIWKRAIASQMADAELERTHAIIQPSTRKEDFHARGEVIKFDGFLKVYIEHNDTDEEEGAEQEGMLPEMAVGETVKNENIKATQRFTKAAPRYNEAALVKKLEEMGIGRPSTYAPTISTIISREYIMKDSREGKPRPYTEMVLSNGNITTHQLSENTGSEKNKLFPTDMGVIVNDFLVKHFPNVVDFHFTANVEEEFDLIADGKVEWNVMIDTFYKKFHETVELTDGLAREDVQTKRLVGNHPETGSPIYVRLGKYGPLAQIGEIEEGETPQYANLRKDQRLETITLDDVLELFKLPRDLGEFEGKKMVANVGRFGPYIKHSDKFISIPKGGDPLSITPQEAIDVILAKRKAEAEKVIKIFEEDTEVQILNGRWGPYISFKGQNVKIPKDTEPTSLTLQRCTELALEAADKPTRNFPGKTNGKTAAKPAAKPSAKTKTATAKAAPKAKATTAKPKAAAKTTAKAK